VEARSIIWVWRKSLPFAIASTLAFHARVLIGRINQSKNCKISSLEARAPGSNLVRRYCWVWERDELHMRLLLGKSEAIRREGVWWRGYFHFIAYFPAPSLLDVPVQHSRLARLSRFWAVFGNRKETWDLVSMLYFSLVLEWLDDAKKFAVLKNKNNRWRVASNNRVRQRKAKSVCTFNQNLWRN